MGMVSLVGEVTGSPQMNGSGNLSIIFQADTFKLRTYGITNHDRDDFRVWPYTRNGDLLAKSTFKILKASNNRNQSSSLK